MLSYVYLAHIAVSIFSLSRETMDFAVGTSTLRMGRLPLLCDKKVILIYFDFKIFDFANCLILSQTKITFDIYFYRTQV